MHRFGRPAPLVLNRGHPLAQGLVSWWKILPSNYGGGRLMDIVGDNHGTLRGTASTSGFRGGPNGSGGAGSWQGNGTDGYVSAPALGFQVGQNYPITVAAWVVGVASTVCSVVGISGGGGDILAPYADNLVYWNSPGASAKISYAAYAGKWTHLVCTWPGAANGVSAPATIYINGSLAVANSGFSGQFIANPTYTFGKGTFGYNPGLLDDIGIWKICLPAQDAADVYQLSRAGWPGLLNYLGTTEYSFPSAVTGLPPGRIVGARQAVAGAAYY